jgi:hypothetical protein
MFRFSCCVMMSLCWLSAASAQDAAPTAPPAAEAIAPGLLDAPDAMQSSADDGPLTSGDSPSDVTPLTLSPTDSPDADTRPSPGLTEFWGYRSSESELNWIVGDGNQFGDFLIKWDHYQPRGIASGLGVGLGFHFLGGPAVTDMPPRLYDFSLSYQTRDVINDLGYDLAAAVLAASDFEGSSRRGIRFPAHAVGYLFVDPRFELALGADFLDRDDIQILPVAGIIWHPDPAVRAEILFPYPRLDIQLNEQHRLFVRGALGGGTWAIERDSGLDDLATYYDLRIGIGLERLGEGQERQSFEIAYLFDRKLEYASRIGDYYPAGTVMLRIATSY